MPHLTQLAILWLAVSPVLHAAEYRYIKIHVPGSVETRANGINARGDVVGSHTDSAGTFHGFLKRNGVYTSFDFPGATLTVAFSLNARGDIVGRFEDSEGNGHAYLLSDGEFTQIDYPQAAETEARGINNADEIVGRYFTSAGLERGFILRNGNFHRILVPDSCSTQVSMAQDNGRVLVGNFCSKPDRAVHGFIGTQRGGFRAIDFPSGGTFPCTGARAVNEKREVVGPYSVANSRDECGPGAGSQRGYLFRHGKFIAIDFPGALATFPGGINNYGVIVGQYTDRAGVGHGFKAIREPPDTDN